MEDLIKALHIFRKYLTDGDYGLSSPTTCEHNMLFVNCVSPDKVSDNDKEELHRLGFEPYEDFAFVSYRFGSN